MITTYDKRALGKLIREKHLDTSIVARSLGVTRSQVEGWSMGINVPRASTLAKIATVLDVSVVDFFTIK